MSNDRKALLATGVISCALALSACASGGGSRVFATASVFSPESIVDVARVSVVLIEAEGLSDTQLLTAPPHRPLEEGQPAIPAQYAYEVAEVKVVSVMAGHAAAVALGIDAGDVLGVGTGVKAPEETLAGVTYEDVNLPPAGSTFAPSGSRQLLFLAAPYQFPDSETRLFAQAALEPTTRGIGSLSHGETTTSVQGVVGSLRGRGVSVASIRSASAQLALALPPELRVGKPTAVVDSTWLAPTPEAREGSTPKSAEERD